MLVGGTQPDKWDYKAAHVPSPLTDSQAQEQRRKRNQRDRRRKQHRKVANVASSDTESSEDEKPRGTAAPSKPTLLQPKGILDAQKVAANIARVASAQTEREKRAAAAEARQKAHMAAAATPSPLAGSSITNGPACHWCKKSLAGIVPFERLGKKYCSVDCVDKHLVQQI